MIPEIVKMAQLVDEVIDWWEEHEYNTTGDYGEINVFDDTPQFVRTAKEIKSMLKEVT